MSAFRCGHPQTPENTVLWHGRYARCRTCKNAYARRYDHKPTSKQKRRRRIETHRAADRGTPAPVVRVTGERRPWIVPVGPGYREAMQEAKALYDRLVAA